MGALTAFWSYVLILKCYKAILGASSFLWEPRTVSSLLAEMDGAKNHKKSPHPDTHKHKYENYKKSCTALRVPTHGKLSFTTQRYTDGCCQNQIIITPYTGDPQHEYENYRKRQQQQQQQQQHWEFLTSGDSLTLHKDTRRPHAPHTTWQYDRMDSQHVDITYNI